MSIYSKAMNYEKVIQTIYQSLLLYEGYENINVQHNITLPCKLAQ